MNSVAVTVIACLVCSANALTRKAKLDINQKVYIEGQAVLGDGAGQGNLNVCMGLADHFISVASKPAVKVCGNGIKMTVFAWQVWGGFSHRGPLGPHMDSWSL